MGARTGTGRAAAGRDGFTVAELLTVIVLVSTLVVAAMPMLASNLNSLRATALAREIATDIRYAQSLAVKTGSQYCVTFWEADQAYAVRVWAGGDWQVCSHPVTKKPWKVYLSPGTRYAGLSFTAAQFGTNSYVVFDKYGSPDNGGAVTFTLGPTTRTVLVAALSGRVTVQ